jgi:hypothetical protein
MLEFGLATQVMITTESVWILLQDAGYRTGRAELGIQLARGCIMDRRREQVRLELAQLVNDQADAWKSEL